MNKAIVSRIRPISWKICVQGEEQAEYVRSVLRQAKVASTDCRTEPDLTDPPVYSFIATPEMESPFTSVELQAFLADDERIEVLFDAMEKKSDD